MTITLRSVKGSALTHGELDGNFTDLQNQLDNAAIAYDPVTLTGAGPHLLTAAAHANRLLICNHTAAMTLTLQTDATGGFDKDDSINAVQYGLGSVTINTGGSPTLRAGGISTTTAQYTLVGAVRIGVNEWTLAEKAASSGGTTRASTFSINGLLSAENFGDTSINQVGTRQNTNGTLTLRAPAATNTVTKTARVGLVGPVSASAQAGLKTSTSNYYLDSLPFASRIVFNVADAIASGTRQIYGCSSDESGLWTENPNAAGLLDRAYLAAGTGDSNFVFVTNDNGGTPVTTAINGGTGFPCNDPTKLYEFTLEYFPTGPRRIVMELKNLTDSTTSGQITFTTRLPRPTVLMLGMNRRDSVANVAAPAIDVATSAYGRFI